MHIIFPPPLPPPAPSASFRLRAHPTSLPVSNARSTRFCQGPKAERGRKRDLFCGPSGTKCSRYVPADVICLEMREEHSRDSAKAKATSLSTEDDGDDGVGISDDDDGECGDNDRTCILLDCAEVYGAVMSSSSSWLSSQPSRRRLPRHYHCLRKAQRILTSRLWPAGTVCTRCPTRTQVSGVHKS